MTETNGVPSDGTPSVGTYDWAVTEPSTAVVEAVASARGVDLTALPPLYDVVDPEGLDALLDGRTGERDPTQVTLTYAGHEVTLDSGGTLTVRPVA